MTTGQVSTPLTGQDRAIGDLLQLLGVGATGGILIALRDGPLRTKELTRRVPSYAPRTVYRYTRRLVTIGAVEREEEPGVPSKVVHQLTKPTGTELCDLVKDYARRALEVLPGGGIVPHSWGLLTLLADLWESGMYGALNRGACTATELARADHDLSFHQVCRRTTLFLNSGLIREVDDGGRRQRYELTEQARRAAVLILGLGRWRERHLLPNGEPGLTPAETAELLRASLPLVVLPEHAGKGLKLSITLDGERKDDGEVVWAEVGEDGVLADGIGPLERPHGWARGEVGHWIETLLRGVKSKVRVGGEEGSFVKSCLQEVHEALWTPRQSREALAPSVTLADSSAAW